MNKATSQRLQPFSFALLQPAHHHGTVFRLQKSESAAEGSNTIKAETGLPKDPIIMRIYHKLQALVYDILRSEDAGKRCSECGYSTSCVRCKLGLNPDPPHAQPSALYR